MSNSNNHYLALDIAKALSIFGVVYIHCGIPNVSFSSNLFRFGVPIFIMISFFLSEKIILDRKINFKAYKFIKNRTKRLLIPLSFWTLFYALSKFILGVKSSIEINPVFGWTGQYFFIVLIQLTLIYPFFRRFSFSFRNILLLMISNFIFIYFPLSYLRLGDAFIVPKGEASFIYWINYMLLGIFIARNHERIISFLRKISNNAKFTVTIFCLLLIIFEFIVFQTTSLSEFIQKPYTYSRISVFFTSVAIFSICFSFENELTKIKSFYFCIKNLSQWSLGIFCLNPFILMIFNLFFNIYNLDIKNTFIAISLRLILSTLVCIIAIFISKLISMSHLKVLVQ